MAEIEATIPKEQVETSRIPKMEGFSLRARRHPEEQYLDLLAHIVERGEKKVDRTGVGTLSVFGAMLRFDMRDDVIPLITTKRVYWKTAAKEMLWFLTGGTNIQPLVQVNCPIWTDWPLDKYRKATGDQISQEAFEARIAADDEFAAQWGELGPVYGKQWRRWLGPDGKEYDQIADVINMLKTNPASRRILFHGWNVPDIGSMALPPCHLLYQFFVSHPQPEDSIVDGERTGDNLKTSEDTGSNLKTNPRPRLKMLCFQRSTDSMLGAPFNYFNASLLLRMIAQQVDMEADELIWMSGDTHLYLNHLDAVKEQLSRDPRPFPKLKILRKPDSIDGYRIEDFVVEGYDPHPAIKADVAV
jgi:thymidylate synthase